MEHRCTGKVTTTWCPRIVTEIHIAEEREAGIPSKASKTPRCSLPWQTISRPMVVPQHTRISGNMIAGMMTGRIISIVAIRIVVMMTTIPTGTTTIAGMAEEVEQIEVAIGIGTEETEIVVTGTGPTEAGIIRLIERGFDGSCHRVYK